MHIIRLFNVIIVILTQIDKKINPNGLVVLTIKTGATIIAAPV